MKNIIKKKIVILLALVIILLVCLYVLNEGLGSGKSLVINGHKIKLEIAKSIEQRKKGLSGREELCSDCGMLFEFPEKGQYGFWMKDMKFSLDIIWILDGKIVHLEKDVQSDFEGVINPKVQADKVLEFNTGKADELGLLIGDKVL
ncbi:MAG: hypothetical protein ACD_5C00145G0002 [uncultured bacterium]|nr:MAG: hypothetical protein ACD_5C00145G0002 [uncultured bacterium]